MSSAADADGEEWEICNDNGFLYKRHRLELPLQSLPPPSPSCDTRSRKKQTLISLKRKYKSELLQWQQISDSLALIFTKPSSPTEPQLEAYPSPPQASVSAEVEELMLQVEAQESILEKLKELCDYVDSICDAEEERMVKDLVNLPIWGNPRCLVTSLTSLLQDCL